MKSFKEFLKEYKEICPKCNSHKIKIDWKIEKFKCLNCKYNGKILDLKICED